MLVIYAKVGQFNILSGKLYGEHFVDILDYLNLRSLESSLSNSIEQIQ